MIVTIKAKSCQVEESPKYWEAKNHVTHINQVTYTEAQTNLDELCEQVISDRDAIITRSDGKNVALIATDELASLIEAVYLLRSRVDYL